MVFGALRVLLGIALLPLMFALAPFSVLHTRFYHYRQVKWRTRMEAEGRTIQFLQALRESGTFCECVAGKGLQMWWIRTYLSSEEVAVLKEPTADMRLVLWTDVPEGSYPSFDNISPRSKFWKRDFSQHSLDAS